MAEHIDITHIMNKLAKAGIAKEHPDGSVSGIISFVKHGHLLTKDELELFSDLLNCNSRCLDEHGFTFNPTH